MATEPRHVAVLGYPSDRFINTWKFLQVLATASWADIEAARPSSS